LPRFKLLNDHFENLLWETSQFPPPPPKKKTNKNKIKKQNKTK